jgi:hypothetical protein
MGIAGIFAISVMVFMVVFFIGLFTGFWEFMYMVLFHKPMRPLIVETIRSLVHNAEEWKVSHMGMKHTSGIDVLVSSVGWKYYHFYSPNIDYRDLSEYEKWKLSRACKDWESITGLTPQEFKKEVSPFVEGYNRLKK